MKIAFVFCADRSFLVGLNKLYKSLVKYNSWISTYDKVLLTDNVDSYEDFKIVDCSNIKYNCPKERFKKTFYKLYIFNLTDYDRIIFIDSDILCLGDISLFLNQQLDLPFYAAKDDGFKLKESINSGVMLVNKPLISNKVFEQISELAKKQQVKKNYGDQQVINEYIKLYKVKTGILDTKYNALKRLYIHQKNTWNKIKDDIRLLHFVGDKPWNPEDEEYSELNKLWNEF